MRISSKEMVVDGVSMLGVRDLLRKARRFNVASVGQRMGLETQHASELISRLESMGYLQLADDDVDDPVWEHTDLGQRLCTATAAPPMKRAAAEKKLREFMARVEAVNADPYLLTGTKNRGLPA